jgi:hypothetical protein
VRGDGADSSLVFPFRSSCIIPCWAFRASVPAPPIRRPMALTRLETKYLQDPFRSGSINGFSGNQSLFLVLLETKVPNGTNLSPRLSKNLSQALRTDRLWPLLRPSNFSTSRLACESWDRTRPSSPNLTPEPYRLFIVFPLSITFFGVR